MAECHLPEEDGVRFFLQDITAPRLALGQRMYYGGWPTEAGRDKHAGRLTKGYNHSFRLFKDINFPSPYFIDNSAVVKEVYGGWLSEAYRNEMQEVLEDELGRGLRRFSEWRTGDQAGVPWGCVNLQIP